MYRAFAPEGGVAGFIRQRRLARIHALISAGEGGAIARLAEEFGFASAAQLARAFRARFGVSISELRARARSAEPSLAPDEITRYQAWLAPLS
jgi:AraC-like DNA-binding protein